MAWDDECNPSVEMAGTLVSRSRSGGRREGVLAFHHTQTPISGDVAPSVGGPINGMGVFVDPGMESWKAASVIEPMCARDYKDAAAIVLNMQSSDASASGICPTLDTGMAKGNRGPTLFHEANDEGKAVPSEDIANAPLFALRRTTDTEAIRQTAGRSERIHASEVLRPAVHGGGVRREAGEDGPVVDDSAPSCAEDVPAESLHGLREGRAHGRASYQRELAGQQAGEPDAPLSVVPHQNAPHAGRPRRLTPKEAERLMSWPDDWTRYGCKDDGTVYELSDTARYRACGNGVGSVCVEWIATRLADAIAQQNGLPMQEAA